MKGWAENGVATAADAGRCVEGWIPMVVVVTRVRRDGNGKEQWGSKKSVKP